MNSAPLPQPAPYTCPHCGAGVDAGRELCPRYGARLGVVTPSGLSLLARAGLGLGLLVFGGLGMIGIGSAVQTLTGPGDDSVLVLTLISAPAFLIGVGGFVACLRPFFKRKG